METTGRLDVTGRLELTGRLDRGDGVELAWAHLPGHAPTVVFLPGFNSDMQGSKALTLLDLCRARGQAMLRLDYSGHGSSGGAFTEGTIGRWAEDARLLIEQHTAGPLILVGSSMGGWIALLLALAWPDRVVALVGIAAAPDFTERLMWQGMTPAQREKLLTEGELSAPSEYGEPYRITARLIEEGRRHLLLDAPISVHCPVRLLHGQCDEDVPWEQALTLVAKLESTDVQLTFIKDGEHRLSREADLALLGQTVTALLDDRAQPLAVAGI